MNKLAKILIGCGAVGLLAGGIAFGVAINKNSEPVINQSVLYIGIPKTQDDLPVKLHITVRSSSGTATKTYSSEELQPLEGQDENLVFLNYSYDPVIPFGNTDIGYWLSDESNSIKVRTECLELIYYFRYIIQYDQQLQILHLPGLQPRFLRNLQPILWNRIQLPFWFQCFQS